MWTFRLSDVHMFLCHIRRQQTPNVARSTVYTRHIRRVCVCVVGLYYLRQGRDELYAMCFHEDSKRERI